MYESEKSQEIIRLIQDYMKDDQDDIGWDVITKRPKSYEQLMQTLPRLNLKNISYTHKERTVRDVDFVYFEVYARLEDYS